MLSNKRLKIPTVRELIKSIPSIRREWKYKTPLEKWRYFFAVGKAALGLAAIPLYEINQTLCFYSYFLFYYGGAYILLTLYTLYYYVVRSEFPKCLPCTCMLGLILSVSVWHCVRQLTTLILHKHF